MSVRDVLALTKEYNSAVNPEDFGFALAVFFGDGIDAANDTGAHEHGALVALHHHASARMAA